MTKRVSAYEARTKFGELMNLVYYKGDTVIVEKMGKPMVRLVRFEKKETTGRKRDVLRWAGIWSDKTAALIEKHARILRKNVKVIPA